MPARTKKKKSARKTAKTATRKKTGRPKTARKKAVSRKAPAKKTARKKTVSRKAPAKKTARKKTARARTPPAVERVAEAGGVVEYRIPANGMRVLVAEHRAAPVATFLVVYRVGSRNEAVGHTGATHLLEHMLFKGTKRFNADRGRSISRMLHGIGAQYNATTWFDRTTYYETVPVEKLSLVVDLEADRMRNSRLRDVDRDSERIVVRNEMERYQNDPESVLDELVYATAFREHPYHHPTIGWRDDVEQMPTERLRAFYDTFYHPNNATAVLVGDVNADAGAALVARYFGKVSPSREPIPSVYTTEPPQQGERRFFLRRPGETAAVEIAYHAPQAEHPDNYPMVVLDAILSGAVGSRVSSRLYQSLVQTGLAIRAYSNPDQFRDPGLFKLVATVNPRSDHEAVEQALLDEADRAAQELVTAEEIAKSKRQLRASFIYAREGTQGLCFSLGEAESKASWRWYVDYLEHVDAVTPEQIREVARKYFTEENRTVGIFVPSAPAQAAGASAGATA